MHACITETTHLNDKRGDYLCECVRFALVVSSGGGCGMVYIPPLPAPALLLFSCNSTSSSSTPHPSIIE
ncbi:uncharacterized protein K452DRAFT_47397 [Aplosporella prunicola CBS 121167]|uniref:Uncharacterized protein n=1 Tax=Aplosporella prunicola CBS 121167 TaxID=1176127 RepID=A0A6A6B944_9PEZI|nr:uncharacterized protein K452DRAFT_47397 [Aplosporella prunicola CBS 121167]KAF2140496.1 hypothetical protein K452DRAFT_47397 [Aplosporella prunicola CBS 121167]